MKNNNCYLIFRYGALLGLFLFVNFYSEAQTYIKDIPIRNEKLETIGTLYLQKDCENEIYHSNVWVEFDDNTSITLDRRTGEMKQGQINVIRNIVEAQYKQNFVSVIWEYGYEGTPIFNLFKIVDKDKNIVQYVNGDFLGLPNLNATKNYQFLDFNTVLYSATSTKEHANKMVKLEENGDIFVYYPRVAIERNKFLKRQLDALPGEVLSIQFLERTGENQQYYGKKLRNDKPILRINGVRG